MRKEFVLFSLSLGVVAASQTACSMQNQDNIVETIQQESDGTNNLTDEKDQEEIKDTSTVDIADTVEASEDVEANDIEVMEKFDAITSEKNANLTAIIAFIEKNVEAVSKENVSTMLLKLEELQIAKRTILEGKFMSADIKEKLLEALLAGKEYSNPEQYQDETLKSMLQESKNSGFAFDHAEGFVYPIIDYSIYDDFRNFATDDIAEYFKIMVNELMRPFAKDAALMIGWEEVVNCALEAEKFLANYKTSLKAEEVKELYQRYEFIALFGLNNTPLFDYESHAMNEEAKEAYEKVLASFEGNSAFVDLLKNYMEILKKADYKQTKEVEEYRNSLAK